MPAARLRRPIPLLPLLQQGRTQPPKAFFHSTTPLAMKVARVTAWGSPPEYASAPDLPAPSPTQLQLKVVAVGVPRVVRARAAQNHPSAMHAQLPYDPSIDGVGQDEATGDLYFINSLAAPLFAERANVERSKLMKLPAGADAVTVAGLTNPTGSSWMALRCRATGGCQGRSVAILGATSASGRIAAAVARALGAARVIGLARNEETLAGVEGLDVRVRLQERLVLPADLGPVHIVLDYFGGPTAVQFLQAVQTPPGENLQYIVVGGLAGYENMDLPVRLVNTKPIVVLGSGFGSLSREDFDREMPGLVNALANMGPIVDVFAVPMADVQAVWDSADAQTKRMVVVP
ncbi:hypothetical protein BDV59DRAFT_209224 [Aspergillus ambiguus]|uniref:uncharacterized protein n=1 Tax=Aspergillus ambiguus TaxID=176160 RepID=UPI003CCDAF94